MSFSKRELHSVLVPDSFCATQSLWREIISRRATDVSFPQREFHSCFRFFPHGSCMKGTGSVVNQSVILCREITYQGATDVVSVARISYSLVPDSFPVTLERKETVGMQFSHQPIRRLGLQLFSQSNRFRFRDEKFILVPDSFPTTPTCRENCRIVVHSSTNQKT